MESYPLGVKYNSIITGDCHANYTKFSLDNLTEQKEMTRDDFVIVYGDFGIWHENKEELQQFDLLSKKK